MEIKELVTGSVVFLTPGSSLSVPAEKGILTISITNLGSAAGCLKAIAEGIEAETSIKPHGSAVLSIPDPGVEFTLVNCGTTTLGVAYSFT